MRVPATLRLVWEAAGHLFAWWIVVLFFVPGSHIARTAG